jgi:hypothetical protein
MYKGFAGVSVGSVGKKLKKEKKYGYKPGCGL